MVIFSWIFKLGPQKGPEIKLNKTTILIDRPLVNILVDLKHFAQHSIQHHYPVLNRDFATIWTKSIY